MLLWQGLSHASSPEFKLFTLNKRYKNFILEQLGRVTELKTDVFRIAVDVQQRYCDRKGWPCSWEEHSEMGVTVSKGTFKHSTRKRPLRQCGKQFPQTTLHAGFMDNNDIVLPDLSKGSKTSRIKNHG